MKKKKYSIQDVLPFILYVVAGIIVGIKCTSNYDLKNSDIFEFLGLEAKIILFLILSIYLHLIIHEAGHLIFGLASGYKFLSFRVANICLQKEEDKLVFKKMSLAGTGGQCLMCVPDYDENGNFPYKVYLAGGVIFGSIVSLITLVLSYVTSGLTSSFFFCFALFGFVIALTNGIPLKTGGIANDGYTIKDINRDPNAKKAFWCQMKVNEIQTKGKRLKELKDDYFKLDENADRKNVLISTIDVMDESRLLDQHRFDEAKEKIEFLLSDKCELIGIYKTMLMLDKVYIDLLETGDADIEFIKEKENQAIIKQMETYPSIIRTQYTIAKVKEKDEEKQAQLLEKFEDAAKVHPIVSEIESERELLELINNKYQ